MPSFLNKSRAYLDVSLIGSFKLTIAYNLFSLANITIVFPSFSNSFTKGGKVKVVISLIYLIHPA